VGPFYLIDIFQGVLAKAQWPTGWQRYFSINSVRVKPGYEGAFAERWREIVAAHETAKVDEHWAVFSVSAGAPTGTFLFMHARKSLAELDAAAALHPPTRIAMRWANRAGPRTPSCSATPWSWRSSTISCSARR
jgi:hypothetical protein